MQYPPYAVSHTFEGTWNFHTFDAVSVSQTLTFMKETSTLRDYSQTGILWKTPGCGSRIWEDSLSFRVWQQKEDKFSPGVWAPGPTCAGHTSVEFTSPLEPEPPIGQLKVLTSLAGQWLYGTRFVLKEFNTEANVGWKEECIKGLSLSEHSFCVPPIGVCYFLADPNKKKPTFFLWKGSYD